MNGWGGKLKAVFRDPPWRQISAFDNKEHLPPAHAHLVPYWTATFRLGKSISDEWVQEQGDHGWGNDELQNYTSSNENSLFRGSIKGQTSLVLRAIVKPEQITSARLTSKVTLERDQGYISACITAPAARVWPAFWMLPSEPFSWPNDGEFDIMESWNNERVNHSCFHWGQHNDEDRDKHRVIRTKIPRLDHSDGTPYGFAWDQQKSKCIWYIDGRPVMQAQIPPTIRKLSEFQIKLNIAVGGNVCGGQRPNDGIYELEVHGIGMFESPPGGWASFDTHVKRTPSGKP